ncbi:hypothetical protein HHI36_016153 [Cryptolaemus montrouzieri]|uniref:Uncharacterized protein n=1 Tax=Cryptolaemus montrouzieri TaxID=559131 RepID=A0ABD2NJJ5_9CUCU
MPYVKLQLGKLFILCIPFFITLKMEHHKQSRGTQDVTKYNLTVTFFIEIQWNLSKSKSSELTTLSGNSITNLAKQRIIIGRMRETRLGKKLNVRTNVAVGDDAEWICTFNSGGVTTEEVEEFVNWLELK